MKQPKTIVVAEYLESIDEKYAAKEMRRLHASNQAMLEALKAYNLKHRMTYGLDGAWDEEITKGEAAIAKGEL